MKKLIAPAAFVLVMLMVTVSWWKPIAKRSKWFIVGTNIYQNLLRKTHLRSDQIGAQTGAKFDLSELNHIDETFESYLKYAGLSHEMLRDKTVLEIGPGDFVGVGLRFLAAGAREVVCIDKFVPYQESAIHVQLYRALRARLPDSERENFDRAVNLDTGVKLNGKQLKYIYGKGIEDAAASFAPHSFDLVVSNAVIEEIYDTDRAFAGMDKLLAPGGYSVHKIDLRDYGMFSGHGFPALEFLTIPDFAYRYMAESTGQPNRRLVDYYRRKTSELGYECRIYITSVLDRAPFQEFRTSLQKGADYSDSELSKVRGIRPRLLPRYRALSDEDLITTGILMVARKPS